MQLEADTSLIRAPRGVCSQDQVRDARFRNLFSASLWGRIAARRKLLALIQIFDDALGSWSWSWATPGQFACDTRAAALALPVPSRVRDL